MVAADDDGRAQLTRTHHLVERQAELGALAQTDPADTCRQPLERDALAGHVQPAVQVGVVRDQFLDLGVGLVDVLGVAGQRRPAERADTAAEQWADVSRDETGEVEGIAHALFLGHLADVVAIVEGRHAHLLEVEHGLHVHRHGLLGGLDHGSRIGGCTILVLGPAPADRQVAIEGIVGAGLVGDHVRAHATAHQLRQDFGGVTQQGDGDGLAFAGVLGNARQGVVEVSGLFVDVTAAQAEVDAGLLALDVQRAGTGQGRGQRPSSTSTFIASSSCISPSKSCTSRHNSREWECTDMEASILNLYIQYKAKQTTSSHPPNPQDLETPSASMREAAGACVMTKGQSYLYIHKALSYRPPEIEARRRRRGRRREAKQREGEQIGIKRRRPAPINALRRSDACPASGCDRVAAPHP